MSEVMKVKVSIEGKIAFEVSGSHREDLELKISSIDEEITVKLCCDSLGELMTVLQESVDSLLSKLKDQSYTPATVTKP